MPFKKTREGFVYDPKGKYRLPPGPSAWSNPKPTTPPKAPPAPKPKAGSNGK